MLHFYHKQFCIFATAGLLRDKIRGGLNSWLIGFSMKGLMSLETFKNSSNIKVSRD